MWKIDGQSLMRAQRTLTDLTSLGKNDANWLFERMSWVSRNIDELEIEMNKLNLPVSMKMLEHIRALCLNPSATQAFTELLSTKIAELRSRIEDEVETRYIFSVSATSADFLNRSRTILNPQVEAAFPDAIYDLLEASDCIGLSRYTASVFHMMRALETALAKAGNCLGATVVNSDGKSLPWGGTDCKLQSADRPST